MALIKIPARSDLPSYKFRIALDGVTYVLKFRYNGRADRWFMDILTEAELPLRYGIKLLTETNIFPILKKENLPQGDFIIFHETGEQINATRLLLGEEVSVFYNEAV